MQLREPIYNTLEYALKDLTYCHSGLSTNRKRKAPQMKNSIQLLFSTRKKRKVPTTVLDKPSYDNADKIQTVLEATETEICSICFHEDDKLAQRHLLHATNATPRFTQHVLKPARSTLSMCVIIVCISRQAIYRAIKQL